MLWLQEKESRLASEAKVGRSFPIDTQVVPLTLMKGTIPRSVGYHLSPGYCVLVGRPRDEPGTERAIQTQDTTVVEFASLVLFCLHIFKRDGNNIPKFRTKPLNH